MAALIVASSLLLSRILGVLREILLARMGGVGLEKSALDLAFLIPDLLNHVVSTGFLSIVFIPLFTAHLVKNGEDVAWNFLSRILNVLVVLMLVLGIPAWIWMEPLLGLLTSSQASPELLARAAHFGRIILPAQLFFLVGTFLVAVQHTRKQFLIPSLTGVVYNISIVAGGWLGRHHGLDGFAWGVPIGAGIAFFVLQWWGVRRGGLHWSPLLRVRDPELLHYIQRMLPLILGVGAMFALEFVIRALGPLFGSEAISSLSYAWRIMYTLVAVFGFSVGVTSYPQMSRLASENRLEELDQQVFRSLSRMIAALVPAMLVVWVLAHPLVHLLLERGAFSSDHTALVSGLLRAYLPAALGLCAQAVLVRAFYARGHMWTPTLFNSAIFLLSLPFYYTLADSMGIQSIPIVGFGSALLQSIALIWVWTRSLSRIPRGTALKDLGISMGILLFGMGAAFITQNYWDSYLQKLEGWSALWVSAVAGTGLLAGFFALQIAVGCGAARDSGAALARRLPLLSRRNC